MKIIKFLFVILLALTFSQYMEAEKRHPKLSMEDLSNPDSPSYVLVPFPKNREEIVANLMDYIRRYYSRGNRFSYSTGNEIDLMRELIKENSTVNIGEIVKVKNKISGMSSDYSYLIMLHSADGQYTSRIAMAADGLLIGGIRASKENPVKKLKSNEQILELLNAALKKSGKSHKPKKIQWMTFDPAFASPYRPAMEVSTDSGETFYVDYWDNVYEKVDEKPFKLSANDSFNEEHSK